MTVACALRPVVLMLTLSLVISPIASAQVAPTVVPYVDLTRHVLATDFEDSTLSWVAVGTQEGRAEITLATGDLPTSDDKKLHGVKGTYQYGTLSLWCWTRACRSTR
jgi:hypothetical protein